MDQAKFIAHLGIDVDKDGLANIDTLNKRLSESKNLFNDSMQEALVFGQTMERSAAQVQILEQRQNILNQANKEITNEMKILNQQYESGIITKDELISKEKQLSNQQYKNLQELKRTGNQLRRTTAEAQKLGQVSFKGIKNDLKDLGNAADNVAKGMSKIRDVVKTIAIPAGLLALAGVKEFADFDAGERQIMRLTRGTEAQQQTVADIRERVIYSRPEDMQTIDDILEPVIGRIDPSEYAKLEDYLTTNLNFTIATGISAEETSEMANTWLKVMERPVEDLRHIFSAFNEVENRLGTDLGKATGVFDRALSTGLQSGFSFEQIVALSTMGADFSPLEAQGTGTTLGKLLELFGSASYLVEDQGNALVTQGVMAAIQGGNESILTAGRLDIQKLMELEHTDNNLYREIVKGMNVSPSDWTKITESIGFQNDLMRYGGYGSVAEVQAMFKENPMVLVQQWLEGIKAEAASTGKLVNEVVGDKGYLPNEARFGQVVAAMIQGAPQMGRFMEAAGAGYIEGTAVDDEAQRSLEGFGAQMKIKLQEVWLKLKDLGEALAPIILEYVDMMMPVSDLLVKLTEWIKGMDPEEVARKLKSLTYLFVGSKGLGLFTKGIGGIAQTIFGLVKGGFSLSNLTKNVKDWKGQGLGISQLIMAILKDDLPKDEIMKLGGERLKEVMAATMGGAGDELVKSGIGEAGKEVAKDLTEAAGKTVLATKTMAGAKGLGGLALIFGKVALVIGAIAGVVAIAENHARKIRELEAYEGITNERTKGIVQEDISKGRYSRGTLELSVKTGGQVEVTEKDLENILGTMENQRERSEARVAEIKARGWTPTGDEELDAKLEAQFNKELSDAQGKVDWMIERESEFMLLTTHLAEASGDLQLQYLDRLNRIGDEMDEMYAYINAENERERNEIINAQVDAHSSPLTGSGKGNKARMKMYYEQMDKNRANFGYEYDVIGRADLTEDEKNIAYVALLENYNEQQRALSDSAFKLYEAATFIERLGMTNPTKVMEDYSAANIRPVRFIEDMIDGMDTVFDGALMESMSQMNGFIDKWSERRAELDEEQQAMFGESIASLQEWMKTLTEDQLSDKDIYGKYGVILQAVEDLGIGAVEEFKLLMGDAWNEKEFIRALTTYLANQNTEDLDKNFFADDLLEILQYLRGSDYTNSMANAVVESYIDGMGGVAVLDKDDLIKILQIDYNYLDMTEMMVEIRKELEDLPLDKEIKLFYDRTNLSGILAEMGDTVMTFVNKLITNIGTSFSQLWENIKLSFNTLWENIKSAFNSNYTAYGDGRPGGFSSGSSGGSGGGSSVGGFATGTMSPLGHKGGPAVVGDGGRREVIERPDGSIEITDRTPQYIPHLEKGSHVYRSINQYLSIAKQRAAHYAEGTLSTRLAETQLATAGGQPVYNINIESDGIDRRLVAEQAARAAKAEVRRQEQQSKLRDKSRGR